ncbi:SUR7/PalI family protein, partial [Ascoidea rubescens DSM 1968]
LSVAISLFLLAGATLMLIFVVMSGSTTSFPINRLYWVEGDTSLISNAPDVTRWTFWGRCEEISSRNRNCDHLGPAYPISPYTNFDTTVNVPEKFVNEEDTFYYLSRFAFGLFWTGLVFTGVSLITEIFTLCSHTFQKIEVVFISLALFTTLTATCLITACVVLVRNAFHDADLDSEIGSIMIGLIWAS